VKKAWLIPLLIVLVTGYALVKERIDDRMEVRRQETDIRYLPSPKAAEFMSFGFKPAVADLFWIEGLNYFGGELGNKKRTYKYIPQYLQIIMHLDPYFTMFYEWASTIAIYNMLPITKSSVVTAVKYANAGIVELATIGRYDPGIISKAAFNFSLEAGDYKNSLPYFMLAGRIFPNSRDMLLVGSTYAGYGELYEVATDLKLEFLGFSVFEAQSKSELSYALNVLLSPRFNKQAANLVRDLRLNIEKDADIREIVEKRFADHKIRELDTIDSQSFATNPKLKKILQVDLSRNWLPPDLHLLFTL